MIKTAELGDYLRNPPIIKGVSTDAAYHEGLKAQLYVYGFKEGYWPVLEATPEGFDKRRRIDCVFCDKKTKKIIVAIELDRYIKKRSLEKLISLDSSIQKIIVSYGRRNNAYYKARQRTKDLRYKNDIEILRLKLYFPRGRGTA